MSQANIDASPEDVFEETSVKCESTTEWNLTLTDYRVRLLLRGVDFEIPLSF